MKTLAQVFAVLVVMALVGAVSGKEAGAAKKAPAKINGVVVKVDGTNLVIKAGKDGAEVTIATDADTEVVIKGQAAKLADLKEKMRVVISPATGTAKKIEVPTPKAPKQK